jgi:hypothetical protein
MRCELREVDFALLLISNDNSYMYGIQVVWDYKNPTRKDDQWHSMIEMKDWLQNQFKLNRGYQFISHNEQFSYVVFEERKNMLLFKMAF